jgi:hypothetical protein
VSARSHRPSPDTTPRALAVPRPKRLRSRIASAALAALACLAPVPGDIGACGQPVQRLDETTFFKAKKTVDCRRCQECSIPTDTCRVECDGAPPINTSFPADCSPLVHDGEVCLRALLEASCDDYAGYVSDDGPTVPTECNFCPPGAAP